MTLLNEDIKNELKRNPAVFEAQILTCFVASHSFFLQNGRSVCEVMTNRKRRQDFSRNWMNVLYEGIATYWSGFEDLQDSSIPRSFADLYINNANNQGRLLDSELAEIEASLANIWALVDNNAESTIEFVENGVFSCWVGIKLTSSLINDMSATSMSSTPEELLSRAQVIREQQRVHEEDESLQTIDQAVSQSQTRGELIHSPWPDLDEKLGGGFAKGEHTLMASVTGGGKTVLATQLASTFALAGNRVILATTEQPPNQLIYRMYSDVVGIPFNYFTRTDQLDRETGLPHMVTTDQSWVNGCNQFIDDVRDNIRFIDWSSSRKTVEADLRPALHAFADDGFEPEVLIFDWIGAALARGTHQREIRHLYENVATELKYISIEYDMSVFSFAQLNKVLAKNKAKCDHTMLHECKSLPDQAVNAVYISGLTNNNEESGETFLKSQMANVGKSRFGPGGAFRITREFQHQRFTTPGLSNI